MGNRHATRPRNDGVKTSPGNWPTVPRRTWITSALLSAFCLTYIYVRFLWGMLTYDQRSGGHYVSGIIDDFRDVLPSNSLQWTPCFNNDFKCAKLRLPMDYERPLTQSTANPIVDVALIMLPGLDHAKSGPPSVSPLLLSPGGPGGSGVSFVLSRGHLIQHLVDDGRDIVSFDPRGVGYSTPTADCFSFPSSGKGTIDGHDVLQGQYNRIQFAISNEAIGLVNSTDAALGQLDAAARATGQLCAAKDGIKGHDSILRHVHTANVARDMLSIVDNWDEWRNASLSPEQVRAEKTGYESTQGKLVYLGFSYGTLLGATFAAMFPNRVGRIVLDGVLDANAYVAPVPSRHIEDADAVFDSFFEYCAEAGMHKCAIARDEDTAVDIRQRVEADLDTLRDEPLIGINRMFNTPSIVTWSQLKSIIFAGLYGPVTFFPLLAETLNSLHERDYNAVHTGMPQLHSLIRYQTYCRSSLASSFNPGDAQTSIMCSDKHQPLNATTLQLQKYFEDLAHTSSFADLFMDVILQCNGWPIKPAKLPGPWGSNTANTSAAIKTSFPLLFVSNSYDPITPLRSGLEMAQKFEDAGLLEQNGEGHCSIAEISTCTISKIRAYFRDGQVPPPPQLGDGGDWRDGVWERCDTDEWPWHSFDDASAASRAFAEDPSVEDGEAVLRAWKTVQAHMATSESVMGRRGGTFRTDNCMDTDSSDSHRCRGRGAGL